MAGITPNEGENYVAGQIYTNGSLKVGLWVGTWNNDETVTYGQADAVFTKITATGLTEQTLNSWSVSGDGATHPTVQWTATTTQTVNGYYIATTGGVLLHVERAASPSNLTNGDPYSVNLATSVA